MADKKSGTIGYALAPKKQNSFIRDSLLTLAKSRGIELVRVVSDRPLADQGPFDCILHKLYGDDWKRQLQDFQSRNRLWLTEFVNHGGVIFKVYVVGERVRCVKRKSLPDISEEKVLGVSEDLLSFSQISNLANRDSVNDDEKFYQMMSLDDTTEMPPQAFIFHITCGIKEDVCIEYKEGKKGATVVAGFLQNPSSNMGKEQ